MALMAWNPARRNRHTARRLLDAQLDDALMFVMRERRRLSRRAHRNQPMRARPDLKLDKFAEGVFFQGVILKWRDERGKRSLEHEKRTPSPQSKAAWPRFGINLGEQ